MKHLCSRLPEPGPPWKLPPELKVLTDRWGGSGREELNKANLYSVRFIREPKPTEYPPHYISIGKIRGCWLPSGLLQVSLEWGQCWCSWALAESIYRQSWKFKIAATAALGQRMESFQQDHVCGFSYQMCLSTIMDYSIWFCMRVCRRALYVSRWQPWQKACVITAGESAKEQMGQQTRTFIIWFAWPDAASDTSNR